MLPLDQLDAAAIIARIAAADALVPAAVAAEAESIAALAECAAKRIAGGGRLIYVGAGTSGRLGALDAAECPPTFGVPPGVVVALIAGGSDALRVAVEAAEDDAAQGAADLTACAVGPDDVVLGIAASGTTPYVLGALAAARAAGAVVAALTCVPRSPLAEAATIAIVPDVGPEVVRGSTRLKAGTAQKLVLNMLSTTVFVLLGRVYADLMIDVQPTNEKLRRRAAAIVAQIAGIDEQRAAELLHQSDLRIRPAVLMAVYGYDRAAAEQALAAAGGDLRRALAERRRLP
ncbi:MAG TPA: N-acetylmuramic acid 6-phosphate etherase [Roseiflexaceae bacterium]|nr:N-acetylmuramic acid 6-phosphate etherase [Roseiflexaceae bacterium]